MRAAFFHRSLLLLLAGGLVLDLSCVTTEPVEVPPAVNVSGESLEGPRERPSGGNLGLEVEANESDSLENLEVLPGVRVSAVSGGGPAALAGVKTGDVILAVDGVSIHRADTFEALEREVRPGREVRIEIRRDTMALEAKVTAGPPVPGAAPVELYRVDPLKLRAGFRSVVEGEGSARRVAAELVKVFPKSPLEGAGFAPGDRILAVSGAEISSAQDLVRRVIEDHDFGERITLKGVRGREEFSRPVKLWAPRRRLTKLVVPILFHYEWRLSPRRTRWSVLDFWLFSIFEVRREEGEREVRLLSLFSFRSGYGELVEEPQEARAGR